MLEVAALMLLTMAADGGWTRASDEDGVLVEQRRASGSQVRELRAEGVIDASPAACLAVVQDTGFFRRTMPFVEVAEVVGREGESFIYFHTRVAPPLCSARESTVRVWVEPLPGTDAGWRQAWTSANERGPAPASDAILVPMTSGAWEFHAIEGGRRTRARYRIESDPGGDLPGWLLDRGNASAVLDAYRELRRSSAPTLRSSIRAPESVAQVPEPDPAAADLAR
jgi:hypothetical protein